MRGEMETMTRAGLRGICDKGAARRAWREGMEAKVTLKYYAQHKIRRRIE